MATTTKPLGTDSDPAELQKRIRPAVWMCTIPLIRSMLKFVTWQLTSMDQLNPVQAVCLPV